MKLKVQLVVCTDDGHPEQVQDVAVLDKPCQRVEHLGLTLADAKQLLQTVQQHLVAQQAATFVASRAQCDHCGAILQLKGQHARTFRTLFGTVTLPSPRLYHCRCQRHKTTTFRPLTALLIESTAPEFLFMKTKWASLISYGLTAQALKDFLPIDATLNATTVQNHTLAVAQRCEDELDTVSAYTQLAQHLSGWTWRDDWQAWCPLTWPAYDALFTSKPMDYLRALEQAGGRPWGGSGALDDCGRPVVPSYWYAPEHTKIVWTWLRQHRTTVTLDLTGEHLVCQVASPQHTGAGTGASLGEAVCAAALAYAPALNMKAPEEHP